MGSMPAGVVSTPTTALGARLRDLRLAAELSQWDMAHKLKTQANRVSDWEIGKHEPTLPVLKRIATAHNMTVAQLLEGVM